MLIWLTYVWERDSNKELTKIISPTVVSLTKLFGNSSILITVWWIHTFMLRAVQLWEITFNITLTHVRTRRKRKKENWQPHWYFCRLLHYFSTFSEPRTYTRIYLWNKKNKNNEWNNLFGLVSFRMLPWKTYEYECEAEVNHESDDKRVIRTM